jgi:putative flippase GtrA
MLSFFTYERVVFNIKQFSKYIVFAGFATVVDFGLLFVLVEFFSMYYLLAAFFACIAGMFTNYIFNKSRTFNNKSKKMFLQFGIFICVALVALILNQVLIYLFVEKVFTLSFFSSFSLLLRFDYLFAKFISMWIVVVWSFFGHKKLTFGLIR